MFVFALSRGVDTLRNLEKKIPCVPNHFNLINRIKRTKKQTPTDIHANEDIKHKYDILSTIRSCEYNNSDFYRLPKVSKLKSP